MNKNKIKKILKEIGKFSLFILAVIIGHFLFLGIVIFLG